MIRTPTGYDTWLENLSATQPGDGTIAHFESVSRINRITGNLLSAQASLLLHRQRSLLLIAVD